MKAQLGPLRLWVLALPIFLFVLQSPTFVWAGDKKAARTKLAQAYKVYVKEPAKAAALAEESLKLAPNYMQARQFLAWLYNVSLGELKKALLHYDWIIMNAKERRQKAEAMAEKGSILFVLENDAAKTIKFYNDAYKLYRNWNYRDKASNLAIHINKIDNALLWAEQSLIGLQGVVDRAHASTDLNKKQKKEKLAQLDEYLTKVKLQVATCHLIKKNKKEADRLMKGVAKFNINHQYNLALYRSAQGDKESAFKAIKSFVDNRKSAKARNQSRDFIETEPLFKGFVKSDERFKKLCVREKE
jgi:hypothetical protein